MSSQHVQTARPSGEVDTEACSVAGLRRFNRIGCVLLPLIIVAVVWASYRLSARDAERALDAEIERLRAAGIIVPIEDLIPKVPPGERNAADVYEQAFAAFLPPSSQDEQLLLGGASDDPPRIALAVAVVERNEIYFDLVDEASQVVSCAFPKDWSDPYASLHQGTRLIGAARWQRVRAEALLSRGEPDNALLCAATILRIGEHLKLEPTIAGQLQAYIMQSIAVGAINVAVSRGEPSPGTCGELSQFLTRVDNRPAFIMALKGEIAMFDMPALEDIRNHSYSPQKVAESLGPRAWHETLMLSTVGKLLGPQDVLKYLEYQEKIVHASSLPWPDIRSAYRDAAAKLDIRPSFRSVLASALTDSEQDVHFVAIRDSKAAELRAAEVALAAAAYRTEHGDYPDSLEELTAAGWDLRADPFGGGPMHYRREGSGFVVWSVGPNLEDDHAVQYAGDPMPVEDGAYDIVFRCERSRQAGAVGSSP